MLKTYMTNGNNVIEIIRTEDGKTIVVDNGKWYTFNTGIIRMVRTYRAAGYEVI